MDTTAIIQFIGIVLFTGSIQTDPGVHAILPRIGSTQTSISFVTGIESHRAVILYRKEDLLERSSSWRSNPAINKDWEILDLDGEHVQFFTDADNGVPAVPGLLPRIGRGPCAQFAVAPTLTADFLPSTSYRGAVAVFDIREGRLDSCESKGPRADTRLFLRTENVLIISAKRPGERAKTVTLDQDAVVFVANVPPDYLSNNPQHNHDPSQPHWAAYNSMLGGTCSAEPDPMHPVLATCDDPNVLTTVAYKNARANPPSKGLGVILDPQCSNSQWP